ncbi:HNH/endonuclease VII fold putative polymorphic toxin [Nocardia sp. NPDC056064]|uniref:HNH/endonuclease VII fold putative polymorphic toxin n=1 Tax=Nocardia sp. NPDC056064 TaxID=3345701 RepID=UPI0035D6E10B
MAANPLIAAKEDSTTAYSGISCIETVTGVSDAISSGSWIEAGLGVLGGAADLFSMAVDPLGTLASYGVGWLIEHCEPLQKALNWIAGDPDQIEAYAKTWDNVATRITEVANTQKSAVEKDVADWTGQAATAYKSHAGDTTNLLSAASGAATTAASAIRLAGGVVAAVRQTVRDLVSQTVARLAVWAAEAVFSLGLATPVIAVQATAYIAKTTAMISKLFSKLAKTMSKLMPLLKKLKSAFGDISKAFKKTKTGGKNADTTPASTKPKGKGGDSDSPDTTPAGTKGDDTSPASTPDSPNTPRDPSDTNSGAPNQARKGDSPDTQDAKGTCGRIEPVDMATGEYFVPIVDLELPGILPVVLWRRHRSNYRYGRWFGPSWSTFLDMRLIVDHAGVTFIGEDGMLLSYPHTAPGLEVVPQHGDHPWPLTLTGHGYRIHDPEREITWHFAALDPESEALGDYPIAGISDRHDNWIRHHYHPNRHPSHLTSSGGYHVTFTTAEDRVTTITVDGTDEHGTPVSTLLREFAYQAGDLVVVTNSVGATTHYTYDRAHRMLTWRDPDNTHFANTYDELGRIVRQEGTDGILNATVSYETLPAGQGTRTHVVNSVGASWTYEFDSQKRLLVETDPHGAATRTDYVDMESRRPFRIVEPDLATTCVYRDRNNNVVKIVRPDSTEIRISYHARNRPATITDADGAVTTYHYDDRGELANCIDPDGVARRYTYHSNGALESITESGSISKTIEVDSAGLPVVVEIGLTYSSRIVRDHFARPIAITNSDGDTTQYTWNPEGQPLIRIDPDGHAEAWSWNINGKIQSHTDRASNTQSYAYGPFGMVESHTGTDGSVTRYKYDTEQQLTAVINPLGQSWIYDYDRSGRLIAESDFNQATTTYQYQPTGQLGIVTPASGVPRHLSYNQLGLLSSIHAETGERLTYSYSPAGNLCTATSGGGDDEHVLHYKRTPGGRILSQQLDDRPPITAHYDRHGRAVFRATPSGKTTAWDYDELGRVKTVTADDRAIALGYDRIGRSVGWRVGDLAHTHAYDKAGHLTAAVLMHRNGGKISQLRYDEYQWRPDGYVTQHKITHAARQTMSRTYDLDSAGRITTLASVGRSGANIARYAYDALNNITDEPSTSLSSPPVAQSSGAAHSEAAMATQPPREHYRNLLVRRGRTHYRYDDGGRLVHKKTTRVSRKPDHWHYRYNAFDQLTDIYTPDGQWWHYTYDAHGRRATKQRMSRDREILERHDYSWDHTGLIEQSTSAAVTSWDYHPTTGAPLTQTTCHGIPNLARVFHLIVTDLIGTPTDLVNVDSASVDATAETDLWGQTTWIGVEATPIRFPGQQYDPETGLHYNHHRYYDPETGRYLTQDPLGLAPAPNPNTYTHNPVTWIDPLGLDCGDGSDAGLPSRREAFHQALRDAGIPTSQQPDAFRRVPMTDRNGRQIFDSNYREIMTQEYDYTTPSGRRITIQDHSAGHQYGEGGVGDQGPHFNVRPSENTRNGNVEGTLDHYPFRR